MEKVWIFVREDKQEKGKQRPMYYTRFVHKDLAGREYVRLYGSRWRIRQSALMNDIFILDGMLK